MPRLPDPYAVRQAPRFGQPLQAPKFVEPVDEGAGLRALAQGVKGLSDEIEKAQIKNDKYATMDALTRLEEAVINNRAGENGWQHKKAADVSEGFFKDESDRFTQTSDEIGSTLTTPNSIEDYNRRAAVIGNRVKGNLINHATAEKEVSNTNTFNATVLLNREAAANNYAIPAEVKIALLNTREAIELRADDLGIDGDAKDLMLKAHASSIHAAVIKEAVDNNNAKYGQIWLDKNRKNMMDEDIDDVEKLLKDGNLREESQAFAEDVKAEGLTEKESLSRARKELSGAMEDAAVARIKALFGEDKKGQDALWNDLGDGARGIYAQGVDDGLTPQESYDLIPQTTLEGMRQSERMALQRSVAIAAKDGRKPPDFEKFAEFETSLEQGDITTKEEVLRYQDFFSDAQNRTAMKLFNKTGTLKITEMKRAFRDVINKTQTKFSSKDELQWRAYQEYMLDKVEDTRRPGDLAKWTDEWIMGGHTTMDYWGDDPDTYGEFITAQKFKGRDDEFYFDTPEEDIASVKYVRSKSGSFGTVDQFYTQVYKPASDYLKAHDIAVNDRTMAAVAILQRDKQVIHPDNIDWMLQNSDEID